LSLIGLLDLATSNVANTRTRENISVYVAVDIMEVSLRAAFKRSFGEASEVMFASVLTRILIDKYRISINRILIIERARWEMMAFLFYILCFRGIKFQPY